MKIKKLFSALFSICILSFLGFTNSQNVTSNSFNDTITIKIEEIKNFKSNSDYDIIFSVKNISKEDIFIPIPIDKYNSAYLLFPEFFKLKFDNLGCDIPLEPFNSNGKKLTQFKKIAPNESIQLSINPSNFMGTDCTTYGAGPYTVQIIYESNEEINNESILKSKFKHISDKEVLKNMLEQIPQNNVHSNIFEISQLK